MKSQNQSSKITIIGLGYVGLPLAVEFGKKLPTIGFDINTDRIQELKGGEDHTFETTPEELKKAVQLLNKVYRSVRVSWAGLVGTCISIGKYINYE